MRTWLNTGLARLNTGLVLLLIFLTTVFLFLSTSPAFGQEPLQLRVKDLARLEGVRENQLTGLGLVVGLRGTGDSSRSEASMEMVLNFLARYGVPVERMGNLRNVAVVAVSAELPPFTRGGDRIDVHVSSIGDAKSLSGGTLLQTPLTSADGKVYAVAQGPLVIGGYAVYRNNELREVKNHPTMGAIPRGALVEREVPMEFLRGETVRLVLNRPDFTTAGRLAAVINERIQPGLAEAKDGSLVEVKVPAAYLESPVEFITALEALPVTPDKVARVVINERTGTVVIDENVRVSPVAVAHGSITVKVMEEGMAYYRYSEEEGEETAEALVMTRDRVAVEEKEVPMVALPAGASLEEIVEVLNMIGANPHDIAAILIAIDQAGALHGVLEIQ
ncbi:MAG TPA: flagellar basal body P-ring protein FlgI [Firmicutes bacterium]|nr:flagellar basal body P-ring protein FlgI [Bacillota bacterium]